MVSAPQGYPFCLHPKFGLVDGQILRTQAFAGAVLSPLSLLRSPFKLL